MPTALYLVLSFILSWRRTFAVGCMSVVLLLPTLARAEVILIVAPTLALKNQPTPSFSPALTVPESSLYGMLGAVLIGGMALWRNRRSTKLAGSSTTVRASLPHHPGQSTSI
jgi:hypothetical protein